MASGATLEDAAQTVGTTRPRSDYSLLVWALIAVGIALRTWEFGSFTSLWFDEVNLARNIAERSYAGLARPLDYGQVAPVGFLFANRLLWSVIHTDWAFRLVPFVASIASLFLYRALARRVVSGIAIPLAIAPVALGQPFVAWSAQFKQYSSDVALALLILLATARLLDSSEADRGRRRFEAAIVGVVAVWFSNPAVLVVGGVGAALVLMMLLGRLPDGRQVVLQTVLPWAIAAVLAVIVSKQAVSPQTMEYMHEYWDEQFPPWPPWSREAVMWYWRALHGPFGVAGLRYPPIAAWIAAALAVSGIVVLWRARDRMAYVLAAPVVAAIGAAAVGLYPYGRRLFLYLIPIFVLSAATAAGIVVDWIGRRSRIAAAGLVAALMVPAVIAIVREHPVYQKQPLRQQFEWLADHRRPGDAIMVWYWAAPAYSWYAARYGLTAGEVVGSGCWPTEPRRFLAEFDRFRGRDRIWLLVDAGYRPEAKLLFDYANQIGTRREGITMEDGVETWLYDFTDSTKLRRASADSFPVALPPPTRFHVMSCPLGLFAIKPITDARPER